MRQNLRRPRTVGIPLDPAGRQVVDPLPVVCEIIRNTGRHENRTRSLSGFGHGVSFGDGAVAAEGVASGGQGAAGRDECRPEGNGVFPHPLSRAESDAFFDRIVAEWAESGRGLYAVERRGDGRLIGLTGLHRAAFEASFTPCIEIGWRFVAEVWGQGYATEAARAVLHDAFGRLGLPRVYSFTAAVNLRSERVMRRLGMRNLGGFDHPALPVGHLLRRHVLYAAARDTFEGRFSVRP